MSSFDQQSSSSAATANKVADKTHTTADAFAANARDAGDSLANVAHKIFDKETAPDVAMGARLAANYVAETAQTAGNKLAAVSQYAGDKADAKFSDKPDTSLQAKASDTLAQLGVAAVEAKNAVVGGFNDASVQLEKAVEGVKPLDTNAIEEAEKRKHHLEKTQLSDKDLEKRDFAERLAKPDPTLADQISSSAVAAKNAVAGAVSSAVQGVQQLVDGKQHLPLDATNIEEAERRKHHLDVLSAEDEAHRKQVEALRDPTLQQRAEEFGRSASKAFVNVAAQASILAGQAKEAIVHGMEKLQVAASSSSSSELPAQSSSLGSSLPASSASSALPASNLNSNLNGNINSLNAAPAALDAGHSSLSVEEVERRKHHLDTLNVQEDAHRKQVEQMASNA